MKSFDLSTVAQSYKDAFSKYGHDPRSLFWLKGRQGLRFQVLCEMGIGQDSSVMDVGCGFGDFFHYLVERFPNFSGKYLGIDILEEFIRECRSSINDPRAEFEVWDLLKTDRDETRSYDYVVASGTFNLRIGDNHKDFVKAMLEKMFQLCVKGVAVNFMSTYVDYSNESSFHASPEEMFALAKSFTKRVSLRHDYMPYEFTIYVYKDDRIAENNVFRDYLWISEKDLY